MDILNFFTAEVIAGIIIIGALALTVRSILMFSRRAGLLSPQVHKLDMMLAKIRDDMTEKKKTIKDLTGIVDPLRAREGKLREYFDRIKEVEIKYERSLAEKGEQDEVDKRKRIQRQKMNLD